MANWIASRVSTVGMGAVKDFFEKVGGKLEIKVPSKDCSFETGLPVEFCVTLPSNLYNIPTGSGTP